MRKKKVVLYRMLSLLMILAFVLTDIPVRMMGNIAGSNVEDLSNVSAASDYGLEDNIQDGTILHCFNWTYNDIKAELPNIAKAGFTSVQTSPAQRGDANSGAWYMLYQPRGFWIADDNGLGTKAQLKALCDEADKYGINVIVDIIANHLAGNHSNIDSELKDSQYWRNNGGNINYNNRWQITHHDVGMQDLKTENSTVQTKVKKYIADLKSIGVDGLRWDTAKHIALPIEDNGEDQFWPNVIDKDLYNYGEILDSPVAGDGNWSWSKTLMKEYTNYMSVTDSNYGKTVRESFRNGKVTSSIGNWAENGVAKTKLVYWSESHDSYSNDGQYGEDTQNINQNVIDRAYAIVAAQDKATSLYFSRPSQTSKESISIGAKGSTHFTSSEVAAVNHFHNAMNGQKEYYVADTNNNIAAVCRETGAVVVKGSGSGNVSITNGGKTTKPGTYIDEITGNTWTVTETTISGTIGSTGIAVFYEKAQTGPSATISQEGGKFSTDTLQLTVGLKNATKGTYQIGNEAAKTYTSSTTFTIGSGMSYGSSVTVKLTATDGTNTTSATYTFDKVEQTGNIAYLSLPSGWSEPVYCYAYDSATETVNNGAWPGVKMTKDSATGYYVYEVPTNIEKPRVIFYSSDTNRTPADMQKGYLFEEQCAYLYKNSTWSKYTVPVVNGTVTVKYVDEAGSEIATATTTQGTVGNAYKTSAATISGYTLKKTPSNATGTYTKEAITVTYVYEKDAEDQTPKVVSSLTEGSSFSTETQEITLTLKNAQGGTYSVDGGPVKSFQNTATVVLGQGKVADSVVTVKTTATSGTETTEYTFIYYKEFGGTVNEADENLAKASAGEAILTSADASTGETIVTSADTSTGEINVTSADASTGENVLTSEDALTGETSATSADTLTEETTVSSAGLSAATSTLASQYKTNATGFGVNKTISVDGSLSDWDSSMIIAQGAANDDPRVYRENSMYEVGVDLYALYGAYDDSNLYLMCEMTNVQDIVAPNDNYPLSQGTLWQTQEFPFFLAVDTGKSADAIGNNGSLQTGGTIWNSGVTIQNSFNRFISINTKGGNGPWVYGGNSTGLNKVEMLDASTSKIKMKFGKGILSKEVRGIDKAYGSYNGRVVGDVSNDSAAWVNFNTKGHNSADYDFFYELSIPLSELGITKSDVTSNGVGVLLVGTMGLSGLDCLPYDTAMNDNANLPDTKSQENNSYEKSDADFITTKFAYIGKAGSGPVDPPVEELKLNFGADRSSPQEASTALTLHGIAMGGSAPYTYKYYVNNTLVDTKTGSSETSTNWVPAAKEYVIKCVVTDSNGSSITSSKYYTIEGETACQHAKTTIKNKKEATCTEAGYTGDTYCATCDALLKSGEAIKALGHNFTGTVTNKKAATCTETGYTGDTNCVNCSQIKSGTAIPATGHSFTGTVTNKEEATCTEAGYTGDTSCVNCSQIKSGTAIPAKGHEWDEGEVITEPTETETGLIVYTCEECGETKEEVLPITGDTLEVGDVVSDEDSDATYRVTKNNAKNREVEYVVSDVKVKKVEIPENITINDMEYKVTSIASGAFKKNKTIEKVSIGENVKKIGSKAFYGCKNLTTVTMADTVTTIDAQAFATCPKLENVTLSANLKSIKTKAFYKCKALTGITIPSKVSTIGKQAFYGCKSLDRIVILTKKLTKKNVGAKAFKGISSTATITVPDTKLAAYKKVLKSKGVSNKATITK